jgi:hypothetical protein
MADSPDGATGTLDIDAAVDRIGASLGDFAASDSPTLEPAPQDPSPPAAQAPPSPEPPAVPVESLEVPKSWKKEMHAHWGKMPREAQEYYIEREQQMLNYMKPFQETIRPYEQMFQQMQRPPHEVISNLLKAHQMLSLGPEEQRWEYAKDLLKRLGFENRLSAGQTPAAQAEGNPADPAIQQLSQKLSTLEQVLTQQQQAVYQEARSKASQTVNEFAADPAHPHFDEVADEIAIFISQGLSLQDAYDRAVWANPAARAKELARVQTETETKFKENARLSSLPKKKAAGVNVRSHDTGRTPTEPLGSMEDTIKNTLREIKQRAS